MPDDTQLRLSVTANIADLQAKMATAASTVQNAAASMTGAFGSMSGAATAAYDQMADLAKSSAVVPASGELNNWSNLLKESFTGIREAFEGLSFDRPTLAVAGIASALKNVLGPMGEVIGLAAGAGFAMVEFGAHTAEAAEHLVNMHLETGISVTALQTWQAAAQNVGVRGDAIAMAVSRMQMRFAELANAGPGASKQLEGALKQLGMTMSDLRDPTNALLEVGEKLRAAMQGNGDYTLIAGEATKIFGRNFRELIPVITQGADAFKKYQDEVALYGLTAYQVVRADETSEAIHGLGRAWTELRDQLGSLLIPVLEKLVVGITDILHAVDLLVKGINIGITTIKGLVEEIGDWARSLEPVKLAIEGVRDAWEKLHSVVSKGIGFVEGTAVGKDLVSAANETKKIVEDAYARGTKLTPEEQAKVKPLAGATNVPVGPGLTPAEIAKQIEEQAKAAESLLSIQDAYNKQRLAYGQETATQEIAMEINLANQKFAIEDRALRQAAAIAGLKPAEHNAILAQITELESKHQVEIVGLDTKLQEARNKLSEESIADEIKANNIKLDYQKALVDARIALDQVQADEGERIKANLTRQEIEYEKSRLEQELALNNQSLEERRKIADQIRDLNAKMNLQILEDTKKMFEAQRKEAQESAKAWDTSFETLGHTMDSVINDALSGTQKLGDAFRKTMADMVKSIIESGLMGLLVGGEKGSIAEALFGTKGGGTEAAGGGIAGALHLGGGIAGLFASILPAGGPSGLLERLLGTASAATSLENLSSAATDAGTALKGLTGVLPGGGVPSTALPEITGTAPSLLPETAVVPALDTTNGLAGMTLGNANATDIASTAKATSGAGGGILGWLFGEVASIFRPSAGPTPSGAPGTPSAPGTSPTGGAGAGAGAAASGTGLAAVTAGLAGITGALAVLSQGNMTISRILTGVSATLGVITALISISNALKTAHIAISTTHLAATVAQGAAQLAQFILHTAYLAIIAAAEVAKAIGGLFFEGGGIVPSAAQGMIVPSAAGGMVAGGGTLAILHPEEMVLPAPISRGVQNMVATASGRGTESGAPATEPGHQISINYGDINAIDARGVREVLAEHAATISNIVTTHLNRKGGRFPTLGVA